MMRVWGRDRERRVALVDAYRFPGNVRHRFALAHQALGSPEIETVERATRQWFRLAARHPKARLSMPSVVVDGLWHEFTLHTREYEEFCESAVGRLLPHTPESGTLAETFRLAREDEPGDALPLLFRADRDLNIEGGHRYLGDCGGRGVCHNLPGTVCLRHVDGLEGVSRRWGSPPTLRGDEFRGSAGDGVGCGG